MGRFVASSITDNERIVADARPHWFMFLPPAIHSFIGLLMSGYTKIYLVAALVWLGFRILIYFTTELTLTNRRICTKFGIIRRISSDIDLKKVEGINYRQGIFGRIFNYGYVTVRGTGSGEVAVKFISKPRQFKKAVDDLIYAEQAA